MKRRVLAALLIGCLVLQNGVTSLAEESIIMNEKSTEDSIEDLLLDECTDELCEEELLVEDEMMSEAMSDELEEDMFLLESSDLIDRIEIVEDVKRDENIFMEETMSIETMEFAIGENVESSFRYTVADGGVIITGLADNTVTTLEIPSQINGMDVTAIGRDAFRECSGLTGNLVIPSSVTSIGDRAFSGCKNLTGDLIIPSGVTYIGEGAFWECDGLSGNLVIPSGVKRIENSAFMGCNNLTGNLVIPESVTSIGIKAFEGCSGLTGNLVIPSSVTSIEQDAFYGCSNLTGDLVIPESVARIGVCAFGWCVGLNGSLKIQSDLTRIEDFAFYHCENLIGDLVIPKSVVTIGESAFAGCKRLSGNVVIPSGVARIEDFAFSQCFGIDKIIFWNNACIISDREDTISPEMVISGYVNSTAHAYALKYNNVFRCIEHIWNKEYTIDKETSCKEAGSKSVHCTVCDAVQEGSEIAIGAIGKHIYNEWITVQQSTINQEGLKQRSCINCNNVQKESIPKLNNIKPISSKVPLKIERSIALKNLLTGMKAENTILSATSSAKKVAVIKNGKVVAQKAGTTLINIEVSNFGYVTVKVIVQKNEVKTTSISGFSSKITLQKGKQYDLNPVVTPITTTDKLSFSSSSKKIVTVNSKTGLLTAKAAGTAKITVKSGSKKKTVTVTVPGITNVKTTASVKKGKSLDLKPKKFGISGKIKYTSSNPKIVTVTTKGKIKGINKGKATITVKAGTYSVKCKVTVK